MRWLFVMLLAAATPAAASGAGAWRMDATTSRLQFFVVYEGTASPGVFKRFGTELSFDPARPEKGELRVAIETASADMDSEELYDGMKEPEWFNMARYPRAEFVSKDIRRIAANRFEARGVLSLKGVRKEIVVPFAWEQTGDIARMSGELTLDRSTFGVGVGEWATGDPIGLEVKVKFNVNFHRSG